MSNIQCEIRSKPLADGIEVSGVAWSDHPTDGDYNFVINKEGASGSTYIVQKSPFHLEADRVETLGYASLSMEAGDKYIIRMTIFSGGRQTSCSRVLA